MSGISKRVNGSWISDDYGIMGTSTDTLATLPAVLYPNDTTATVGLKGNMSQSGTPTPTTLIMPQGTGERTENLFDGIIEVGGLDINTGAETGQTARRRSDYIEIEENTNYNLSRTITATTSNLWVLFYDDNKDYISGSNKGTSDADFTVLSPANAKYLRWYVTANASYDNFMIIEGSIAPSSYIPYGYKIPISSGDTTTNNYLGEVESTRKIKKLVFTGNETIGTYDSTYNRFSIIIPDSLIIGVRLSPVICSHYQAISDGRGIANVPNNAIYSDSGTSRWFIKTTEYTNDTDFKSYLQQQYAAGTPVTIWYVLATETTGIVNEPLMRIGDYADTLNSISIPVTAGGDTISVDTTVQPSEVTATYKGWHPVQNVHERDNGAWT